MTYDFDYDEIYGTEGQAPSVYYPGGKEEYSYWDDFPDIEELAVQGEQEQKKQLEQKQKEREQPTAKRSPSKHGDCAPAYRRELDVCKMYQLSKKGYSYRKIAELLGCSPNTVRNRLKDEQLLRTLWLE